MPTPASARPMRSLVKNPALAGRGSRKEQSETRRQFRFVFKSDEDWYQGTCDASSLMGKSSAGRAHHWNFQLDRVLGPVGYVPFSRCNTYRRAIQKASRRKHVPATASHDRDRPFIVHRAPSTSASTNGPTTRSALCALHLSGGLDTLDFPSVASPRKPAKDRATQCSILCT